MNPVQVHRTRSSGVSICGFAFLAGALLATGCDRTPEGAVSIRLTDVFHQASVAGTPFDLPEPEPLDSWQFGQEVPDSVPAELRATGGWRAVSGVTRLGLQDGRLSGTTTSGVPIIAAGCSHGPSDTDLVHSIEIRMRVSAGSNLTVDLSGSAELDPRGLIPALQGNPFREQSPIIPGDSFQTYTVTPRIARTAGSVKHLVLVPTDAVDATFEIESVRVVSRREHLSRTPSGVGWQGLAEIYRESIVARTPEVISWPVVLPEQPWLELNLGTVDHPPVTFKVVVDTGAGEVELVEKTVTTSQRWEFTRVDLAEFAGDAVTLRLSLAADGPGQIGLWGGVAIRDGGSLAVAGSSGGSGRGTGAPPTQGVILVLADTLRRDHLEIGGYQRETAPHLRRLAEAGALFTDNIAQATWTKVSVPSLMTSMLPTSLRIKEIPDRLSAKALTLAEVYHGAGFATVAYSSVPFTGKLTNLHQGFEEVHEVTSVRLPEQRDSKTAREYVDRLTVWLERHRDGPFFVFLHVFDPHDPFEPFEPYNGLWADLSRKEEHQAQLEKVRPHIKDPLLRRFGMPTSDEFAAAGIDGTAYVSYDKDWYDGSIRAMDMEIARLMQRLRELGLHERTLLVFTSDHGEEFLEHGRTFHGQSLYGELTNVPLFFHQPGNVPTGVVVDHTVRNLDIMPTLLELSGLPVPPGLAGQSLVPLMSAAARSPGQGQVVHADAANGGWEVRPAIAEKARTSGTAGPGNPDEASTAIVLDGWKLIHNSLRKTGNPEFELFRHREDPLNLNNVADQHPEVVERLAGVLRHWLQFAEENKLPEGDPTEGLSKEELDRLRSLGYIQ